MIGPIYAVYVDAIGGDLLDASYTFGLYSIAAGLTAFAAGGLSDSVRENELVLVAGYTIKALGFLGYLFVDSIWTLFAVQVVIGIGQAVHCPAFDVIFSKHMDEHTEGKSWGAWEAINYGGAGLGAIIGGYIVTLWGFNALFFTMAIISFLSAGYILVLPRNTL